MSDDEFAKKQERWRREKQALDRATSEGAGKINYMKLQPGPNVIRIIPAKAPREDFYVKVRKSYNIGPNNKVVTRPSQHGEPDPVGEEIARLNAAGDEASTVRAKAMKDKTRYLMWIIDRAEEAAGYKLLDGNVILTNGLFSLLVDGEYGDVTDPEKGFDLTIHYTPGDDSGKNKKFKKPPQWQIIPKRMPSPLGHPEALEVDLFDKHRVGQPSDVGYAQACLEGTEEQWIEEQKALRAAGSADEEEEEAEPVAPPPKADMAATVAKAKEEAKAKAAKAPKKPKAPAAPPPAAGTPKALLDAEWWVAIDGTPTDLPGAKVQEMLDGGDDPQIVAQTEPNPGWQPATKYGFLPGRSQVGRDLEEALS